MNGGIENRPPCGRGTKGGGTMAGFGASRTIEVDGRYRVWTHRVGTGEVKVLLLHGGPGCTHEYLEVFERHLPRAGIEFYYYDQLGSFYSDQPDDPSLWTVDRFREEVEQVRTALGLEHFYLYGQSWGGMLAIEYALSHQEHLAGLVVSNMTASIDAYMAYTAELRQRLPAPVQAELARHEAAGDFDDPAYTQLLIASLYNEHLCRVVPWPEPVARMFGHMATQVYNTMQGPNEFVVTGNFRRWNRWHDLGRIAVPSLLMVGRHDTMRPADIEEMGRRMPDAQVAILEQGSHLAMWDDEEAYFEALIAFLRAVHDRPAR